MKKTTLITVAIVLFSAGCSLFAGTPTDRFVNPLFYEQLIPLSSIARETYLTPTSLKSSNSPIYRENDDYKDGWDTAACRLLENEQEYIVMRCEFYNPVMEMHQVEKFKFTLEKCPPDSPYDCRYFVIQTDYDIYRQIYTNDQVLLIE